VNWEKYRLVELAARSEKLVELASARNFRDIMGVVKQDPELVSRLGLTKYGALSRKVGIRGSAFVAERPLLERVLTNKYVAKVVPERWAQGLKKGVDHLIGPGVGVRVAPKAHPETSILGSPIAKAIHEIGHGADKGLVKRYKTGHHGILESERIANRNAIGLLNQVGASGDEIADYRAAIKPGFRSYQRSAFQTERVKQSAKSALKSLLRGDFAQAKKDVSFGPGTFAANRAIVEKSPYIRGYGFSASYTKRPLFF
jgi:hypothetical protein